MISQKTITIISIIDAVLLVGLVLAWQISNNPPAPDITPGFSPISYETPITTIEPTPFYDISERLPKPSPAFFQPVAFPSPSPVAVIQDPGVAWLGKPLQLKSDPGILKSSLDYVRIFKVGTQNGKDLLLVLVSEMGEAGYLLRTEGSQFVFFGQEKPDFFSDRVFLDTKTEFLSLKSPEKLEVFGVKFSGGFSGFSYFFGAPEEGTTRTLFAYAPYGPMYLDQETATAENPLVESGFVIRKMDGGKAGYELDYGFMSDDSVPRITWNDGTRNSDRYITRGFGHGCGFGKPSVVPFSYVNGKIFQSGATSTGEPVYEFVNPQDQIVKMLYDYTNGAYYDGELKILPLSEFIKRHGVFLYRDKLGRFNLFSNGVFGPQAECGKPVIYLYSTKPTQVSVKVGAKITVSEPAYNDGWNVLAEPTGKQTLFWEGLGMGAYPEITEGTIVPRDQLEATLWSQLAQLGLNDRESKDFMDFWFTKMPTTPYIRLTWFGAKQMNELAPLFVSPKPDTVIRVFLDFEGLQKQISLPSQRLTAIPRVGFTLVEWGGLLRK